MRSRFAAAALLCVITLVLLEPSGSAADMNGPMSSGKKPEVPAGAQAPDAKPAADAKSALDVEKLFRSRFPKIGQITFSKLLEASLQLAVS